MQAKLVSGRNSSTELTDGQKNQKIVNEGSNNTKGEKHLTEIPSQQK